MKRRLINSSDSFAAAPTTLELRPFLPRWLAVGGSDGVGGGGLQIFHFNGANPVTLFTGLLTNLEIDQFFWDNANHLYAISQSAGKLFVFTVTPTSAIQAPGSPYTIAHPQNIAVQPKAAKL
jgi:hypothetical protein